MSQLNSSEIDPKRPTAPFLLEIGSEEIPARFIPGAMAEMEKKARELFKQEFLSFESMRVVATPRRMTLLVEGLSLNQPDRKQIIKGPPVSIAFDAEGNPTGAGLGFARKVGMDLADCGRGQDKKGEHLLAEKLEHGQPAALVLREKIPALILGIPFRKTMRWGSYDVEYPRPLQWILALLGNDVVPLQVDYLASGRTTRGHRTLSSDKEIEIPHPEQYMDLLREVGVMVDHLEREQVITAGFATLLAEYDEQAQILDDTELLREVVFLCEYPTPMLGTFRDVYGALPDEVITIALKSHQRYFTVGRKSGEGLMPCFAVVRDGGSEHLQNVIKGNEKVLHARLEDALFYWTFDQKKSPDERISMLESVTWMEGYGSVKDKVDRVSGLVEWLWSAGMGNGGDIPADLVRAAAIAKSDLVSEMIKDGKKFTKLEGLIGARYAAGAGENDTVCRIIERHYHPKSAGGQLPGDSLSAILSVAERLDTLTGCWLAGFVPTGAKDPYALRRHVLAILRILLAEDSCVNLEGAVGKALDQVSAYSKDQDLQDVSGAVGAFIQTRMAGYFVDSLKCDAEAVRAVLPVRWRDPVDALAWTRALAGYRDRDDFQLLATGFKRCRNILKGQMLPVEELDACLDRWVDGGSGSLGEDFGLLPEEAEKQLHLQVAAVVRELKDAEFGGGYEQVFAILSSFGPSIDRFFEEVRVNVDDNKLTALRHGFLREIHGLFARFADFTEVVASEE